MFAALPKNTVAQTLGKQVLRSGTSVGANYREADSGRSKPEFIAKMGDCLKELSETDYWLELMAAEEIIPPDRLAPLIKETRELIAISPPSSKRPATSKILHFSFCIFHFQPCETPFPMKS